MAVNLGDNPDLTGVQADYDGDMAAEPVADELTDLIDSRARVRTGADGLVVAINGLDYVVAELPDLPTEPASTIPAASEPTSTTATQAPGS